MAETPKKANRCYDEGGCPFLKILEKQVQAALPRWVFISAFGTLCAIAFIFAGWHVSSLSNFDEKYFGSVKDLHEMAEGNKNLLIEVKTKQDMVLQNIATIKKEIDVIKANGKRK